MINQPKNIITRYGNTGSQLIWSPNFANHHNMDFAKAQKFIDSECIRLMKPYTPFLNGVLEKSATLGTVIGSGQIKQNTPYARYQYYGELMVSSTTGSAWATSGESKVLTGVPLQHSKAKHPQAGKMWFERMKEAHKQSILAGAQKYASGGR